MNTTGKMNGGRFLGERQRMKLFQRNRRGHDPMLVLNMSIFNLSNGWDRVFNPLKGHENGTR